LRVRLAADYGRLEFLRVLRSRPQETITSTGDLILPAGPDSQPEATDGANPTLPDNLAPDIAPPLAPVPDAARTDG